jgi:hypothetical protein
LHSQDLRIAKQVQANHRYVKKVGDGSEFFDDSSASSGGSEENKEAADEETPVFQKLDKVLHASKLEVRGCEEEMERLCRCDEETMTVRGIALHCRMRLCACAPSW